MKKEPKLKDFKLRFKELKTLSSEIIELLEKNKISKEEFSTLIKLIELEYSYI